jgi:peptidyl-prolyl cis-trans isomerase SurA
VLVDRPTCSAPPDRKARGLPVHWKARSVLLHWKARSVLGTGFLLGFCGWSGHGWQPGPRTAQATIVERVVAVVADKAILLSDLRERARPFQMQIYGSVPEGASRNAALSQLYKQLVERLVDEELQSREAARSNISVSAQEVETAIERVAKQNDVSEQQLFDEAQKSGLSPADYRQEIRRQLLDAKMLNLRTQGHMRVSEDDMRSAYHHLTQEERRKLEFRAAWIRMQIPPGSGPEDVEQVHQLAEQVAARARAGTDFAELAHSYSSDPTTRESGGLLAPMHAGDLPAEIDTALLGMEVGEVTSPIRQGDAWVVLKLVERAPSQLPDYEKAKPQLQARVYGEKMESARRQWLESLRKRTHVDIRL